MKSRQMEDHSSLLQQNNELSSSGYSLYAIHQEFLQQFLLENREAQCSLNTIWNLTFAQLKL